MQPNAGELLALAEPGAVPATLALAIDGESHRSDTGDGLYPAYGLGLMGDLAERAEQNLFRVLHKLESQL